MNIAVNFRRNMRLFLNRIKFKRIISFFCILLSLFGFFPRPSYAAGEILSLEDYQRAGAVIIDLYGMYNNTNLAYDLSDQGSALTVIQNLYNDYQASSGDPYTLAAIGAAALAAGCIAVVYDAVTGQGYIQLYQEQYVRSLDGFWNEQYSTLSPGILLDADLNWFWNNINGVNLYQDNSYSLGNIPLYPVSVGMEFVTSVDYNMRVTEVDPGTYCFYYSYNNVVRPLFINFISGSHARLKIWTSWGGSYTYTASSQLTFLDSSNVAHYFNPAIYNMTGSFYPGALDQEPAYISTTLSGVPIPVEALGDDPDFISRITGIDVVPYIGDPLIGTPNIERPDYEPQPVTIPTNVPLAPGIDPLPDGVVSPVPGQPYPITDPSDFKDIIDDLWERIINDDPTDDPQIDPDPDPDPDPDDPGPDDPDDPDDPSEPDPGEVHTPLLPFLPNFNFNLSSIWYYVVNWVNSFKGFVTLLFNVWSYLPYAIVLPVYATAVIVVVVGVYRRFFM